MDILCKRCDKITPGSAVLIPEASERKPGIIIGCNKCGYHLAILWESMGEEIQGDRESEHTFNIDISQLKAF
jgi:RNase P subunit RPR2